MRPALRPLLCFLAVVLLGLPAEGPARTRKTPVSLRDFTARVTQVRDGDSLEVKKGEDLWEVRLARIDAPESRQKRGEEAQRFTEMKVKGQEVRVRSKTIDGYGRLVADITYAHGRSLNEDIVAAGWAWWYKRLYPKDADMERHERRAREQKLGLWQDKNPDPPWSWRQKNKP